MDKSELDRPRERSVKTKRCGIEESVVALRFLCFVFCVCEKLYNINISLFGKKVKKCEKLLLKFTRSTNWMNQRN